MAHFGQLNLVTLLRSLQDFTNHRTLCHFGHLITSMALWFYIFTAQAQQDRIPSFYFDKALDNVRSYLIYTFTACDMVFSRSCLSRATNDRPLFTHLATLYRPSGVFLQLLRHKWLNIALNYQMATFALNLPTLYFHYRIKQPLS